LLDNRAVTLGVFALGFAVLAAPAVVALAAGLRVLEARRLG